MRHAIGTAAVISLILIGFPAAAQDRTEGEGEGAWAKEAERVFACRQITAEQEKLACYEREVAALETAVRGRDVLVVDREDVREARRGLFGFNLPSIKLFEGTDEDRQDGGDDGDSQSPDRLEAKLVRTSQGPLGRLVMTLDTGAQWMQIDNTPILREPKRDDPVVIRKATLGSFMASIGGARSFRVRRVQ